MKKLLVITGLFILSLSFFRLFFGNDKYFGFTELLLNLQSFEFNFDYSISVYNQYSDILLSFTNSFTDCSGFTFETFITDFFGTVTGIVYVPVAFIIDLIGNIFRLLGLIFGIIGGVPA